MGGGVALDMPIGSATRNRWFDAGEDAAPCVAAAGIASVVGTEACIEYLL